MTSVNIVRDTVVHLELAVELLEGRQEQQQPAVGSVVHA